MAKMGCYCGAAMSNVSCPSENVIYVMKKERVVSALKYNPQITLIDFITNWDVLTNAKKLFIPEDYDFWYCTECKRVYKSDTHIGGNKLAAYKLDTEPIQISKKNLSTLSELIVFTDKEEDDAIEKEPQMTLSSFLASLTDRQYYISDNEDTVYVYDRKNDHIVLVYRSEKLLDCVSQ
jgi:hypothetical protein